MRNTKPSLIVAVLVAAFAMTGCGKKNNNAGAPLPGQPGYPTFPQGNFPPGTNPGQMSGMTAQGSMMARVDSASVVSSGGGYYYGCSIPYGEQLALVGQSQDGIIQIQGTSQNCSAQIVVQVQLSQLVVQDIMRQMNPYGSMYGYPQQVQLGSVAVAQVNLSRAGNRVYDGGLQNRASVLLLINGQFPYLMYF